MPNINKINNKIENSSLTIKNKLKTITQVINVNEQKQNVLPSESEGIFASWNNKLNRQPATDLFIHEPINKAKINKKK